MFWKYAITADSSNSPYLTFPEPGYSLAGNCYLISQCLRVRVYTSSIRRYNFMLWLYPQYDQDPIGIPYMVDVTPCSNYASLGVSSQPPWLYIDKSPNAGNTIV